MCIYEYTHMHVNISEKYNINILIFICTFNIFYIDTICVCVVCVCVCVHIYTAHIGACFAVFAADPQRVGVRRRLSGDARRPLDSSDRDHDSFSSTPARRDPDGFQQELGTTHTAGVCPDSECVCERERERVCVCVSERERGVCV